MVHGDADYVVGGGDGFGGQAVAFGAEDDGEAGYGGEEGMVDGYGAGCEGHGCCLEAEGVEGGEGGGWEPSPWEEED